MKSLRDLIMSVGFSGSKAIKGLKDVDKAADKAKKNMEDLGKQATNTGKGIDNLGKDSSVAKRALDTLGRGLDNAKRKTQELGTEAKRVGQQMRTDFKQAMEDAFPKDMYEGARRLGTATMAGGLAGAGVLGAGAKTAISFESAFAGVRKPSMRSSESMLRYANRSGGLLQNSLQHMKRLRRLPKLPVSWVFQRRVLLTSQKQ